MTKEFEISPIRPPSEAESLLLRITRNCSWNKCKFCKIYKTHGFSARSIEEIKADIDQVALYRNNIMNWMSGNAPYNYTVIKEKLHGLTFSLSRYPMTLS